MELIKKIFSRKKSVPHENNHSVSDYDETYMSAIKVMRICGIRIAAKDSSFTRSCWNAYYWFEFVNLVLSLALNLRQLRETMKDSIAIDITLIFRILPCVGYLILAKLKSYKMLSQRPVYENLVSELRGMWPEGPVHHEDHGILCKALKEINSIMKGYFYCNFLLVLSCVVPAYFGIIVRAMGKKFPRILPFNYWMPFDQSAPFLFELTLTWQAWHTLATICFILSGDFLFCIFLSHITTQFKLVSARIKRLIFVPIDQQLIPDYPLGINSNEMEAEGNSETFDEMQRSEKEMCNIVIRHKNLIRLANDVEDLFSFSLLFNFFYSSIIICFCGFCCVRIEKWNEFMYKIFLTTSLCQIWLLCWFGQKLLDSSCEISNALYESGWYRASKKIKTAMLIMIHRAQKEVHVTTYGFSVISLASYTTIIKTAWSYFTLLLNNFHPA